MIDIHSHILPKVDDGSESLKMTYEMLDIAAKNGTRKIIATPHFCDGYELSINRVKARVRMLNRLAERKRIPITIYYGQEVYITKDVIKDYEKGKIGTINDSRYMLMELSMMHFNQRELDIIYELKLKGVQPIIAHPERYLYLVKNPRMINRLIDEGYLFQLNAGSIEGIFGRKIKKTAKIFLKHKIYSFIGSDGHNNKGRSVDLKKGLRKIKGDYKNTFEMNSEKMLTNQKVNFNGRKIADKSFLFFRKKI